ncbi:MAG TPA: restriction endonuclease subunit S [Fimbriimonadaceae bacterium]|nr:restriction endonuclease subunit S [Fimbriimonadaceae bacterium]
MNGLVPKLRFPKFRECGAWPGLNGDRLFNYIDRRPAAAGLPILAITQEQGAVPRDQIDYHVSVTDASVASYKEVRPGDFIISLRSFQGGIEYSRVNGICSPAYIILGRKGDGDDDFYRHLFKSDRFIQQITRNIEGIRDGKMISFKQFSEELLPAPSRAEQRKIAECLTSLDELIAAEGQRLEALRKWKKALLQNLFPREGETTPRLRFPEFRNAAEWKEEKLGQLGRLVAGLTYRPDDVRGEGLLVLRSSNIREGQINLDDSVYVRPDVDANISEPNDILICVRNGSKPLIGKNAMIPSGLPRCTHGAFMTVFRAEAPHFVHQLFQTAGYRKQVAGDLGATINSINGKNLLNYRFIVPSAAEQRRIASCLGSLDALITGQAKKLDTLKTHKQGLMQGLFPSPESKDA